MPPGWQEEILGGLLGQHYKCDSQPGGKHVYSQNDAGMTLLTRQISPQLQHPA